MRRLGKASGRCSRRMVLLAPRCERGETRRGGGRLLTPSGEIEYEANFTRDTAIDSLPPSSPISFFFALRSLSPRHSFRTDKRTPFFPVVSANRGIGNPSNAYSVPRACLFFFFFFFTLPYLRCLYFCLPLSLFSPRRCVFVFFFSYWHRFHKYSIAGNVPRDCKTSGRFRLCRVLCAFELDMAKVDVSLARSLRYP